MLRTFWQGTWEPQRSLALPAPPGRADLCQGLGQPVTLRSSGGSLAAGTGKHKPGRGLSVRSLLLFSSFYFEVGVFVVFLSLACMPNKVRSFNWARISFENILKIPSNAPQTTG